MSNIKVVVSIDGKEEWQINTKIRDEQIAKLRDEIGDKIITSKQIKQFFKLVLK